MALRTVLVLLALSAATNSVACDLLSQADSPYAHRTTEFDADWIRADSVLADNLSGQYTLTRGFSVNGPLPTGRGSLLF